MFKKGTILKGKDLKDHLLVKILPDNLCTLWGFQYKIGVNIDVKPLNSKHRYFGLHFCCIEDVFWFLDYGTKLAILKVPDNENVYIDDDEDIVLKSHVLEIVELKDLNNVETFEFLIKNGANIHARDDFALKFAIEAENLLLIKTLIRHGSDIHNLNNKILPILVERIKNPEVAEYVKGLMQNNL